MCIEYSVSRRLLNCVYCQSKQLFGVEGHGSHGVHGTNLTDEILPQRGVTPAPTALQKQKQLPGALMSAPPGPSSSGHVTCDVSSTSVLMALLYGERVKSQHV